MLLNICLRPTKAEVSSQSGGGRLHCLGASRPDGQDMGDLQAFLRESNLGWVLKAAWELSVRLRGQPVGWELRAWSDRTGGVLAVGLLELRV